MLPESSKEETAALVAGIVRLFRLKGAVTVLSPTEIRVGELYRFLESILAVKGFAAVPAGDHVKIIPQGHLLPQ